MFENILSSRFYAICNEITRLIYITIIFIIFSLPIITIGASLTALIATIRQPEYKTLPLFWQTFKENLLRGGVVLLFTAFSTMFLVQLWQFAGTIPAGNIIFIFIAIFLSVYNLNAYLFVSIIKKCGITFFRQIFFFTIGTLYKTFLVPVIAIIFAIVAPIIGGYPLAMLSTCIVLSIYVKIIKKDLELIEEYL